MTEQEKLEITVEGLFNGYIIMVDDVACDMWGDPIFEDDQ